MGDDQQHGAARRLWAAAEAIHAVTYFHPTCRQAMTDVGTRGFWMGYFVGRMAPLGAIEPSVAEAVAFGFSAVRPYRALPDGWTVASPATAVRVRTESAAAALVAAGVASPAASTLETLTALSDGGRAGGHALGAANQAIVPVSDPHQRLWQQVTWLREQRGDDHVALWVGHGFDGCEANVLTTAVHDQDPEILRGPRAWSIEEWEAASQRLSDRGLLSGTNGSWSLTDAGRAIHDVIEGRTDALSAELYARAAASDVLATLTADLEALARPLMAGEIYPFPNPMGLPPR